MLRRRWAPQASRLVKVGLPLMLVGGVLVVLSVLGRYFLSVEDYATWALLMTVITGAAIFDLGATSYMQAVGYGSSPPPRTVRRALALAAMGAAAMTALAALVGVVWGESLAISTPLPTFVLLIVTTGFGSVLRNGWSVSLAALQIAEKFHLRTITALVQSVAQVGVCWALLESGFVLWSLPISLLISSAAGLACGLWSLLGSKQSGRRQPAAPLMSFASIRTVSAVVLVASTQADRWVLSSFAPASFVADYDFALRLAALPLGVVASVSGGLIAESAALATATERNQLVRRLTPQIGRVIALLSLLDVAVLLCLHVLGIVSLNPTLVAMFALALSWMGINALTAPSSMGFVGAGRPEKELLYAVPAVVCSAIGWCLAALIELPWLVPLSTATCVIGWSVWFVIYSYRPVAWADRSS